MCVHVPAGFSTRTRAQEPAITRFESFVLDAPEAVPGEDALRADAAHAHADADAPARAVACDSPHETSMGAWAAGRGAAGPGTGALRLYVLRPETGRTHQLRVAMKANGVPIAGDALYANSADAAVHDRAYLHAAALRVHMGGERVSIVCPPDNGLLFASESFQRQFQALVAAQCQPMRDVWFPDNAVLRSALQQQPPAELADLWEQCGSLAHGMGAVDGGGTDEEDLSTLPGA